MVKRKVHNTGSPIQSPNGTILTWLRIVFMLVDREGRRVDVFDRITGEKFLGEVDIKTDANGEFEVELFPNSRGDKESFYLVHIHHKAFRDFQAVLTEGDTDLTFMEFQYSGQPINPVQYDVIQSYIQDLDETVDEKMTEVDELIETKLDEVDEAISTIVVIPPYEQETPSDTWIIEVEKAYPSVTIIDNTGALVYGSVSYSNEGKTVTIEFSEPIIGTAYFN